MQTVTIVILLIILGIGYICIFGPEIFPLYDLYATKRTMYEKQQWVRLLDIFIFGPVSIYIGYKLETDTKSWSMIPYLLYSYGIGTIIFNFLIYSKNIYG